MTREDIEKLIIEVVSYSGGQAFAVNIRASIKKTAEAIYDDFESRICDNCIYGEPFANPTYSMVHCELSEDDNPKTYGCNGFERKE